MPPGLASLPGTSLRATRPDVVRDDGEQAKLLCHSGFRETSRNFTYLCWVLPECALRMTWKGLHPTVKRLEGEYPDGVRAAAGEMKEYERGCNVR